MKRVIFTARSSGTPTKGAAGAVSGLNASPGAFAGLLAALLLLAIAPAFTAPVLKGSVELSAERTVLDKRLAPGNKFDSKLFGETQKEERWEQIPEWLAGTWKQSKRTRTFNKDEINKTVEEKPVTFQSVRTIKKGFQRKDGKIWDFFPTGVIESVASDFYTTYSYLMENDPITVSQEKVVAFRCTINVCVDNRQQIKDTYQTEEIESFINDKSGVVRNELKMRTFDMRGKPRATLELWSPLARVAPYADTAKYEGMDMNASLARYLTMKAKSTPKPLK